jgi:redox-sensitive bicupin YhaK (pirin superfamily)
VVLSAADPAQLLLLGGEPFGEPILLEWNFVG